METVSYFLKNNQTRENDSFLLTQETLGVIIKNSFIDNYFVLPSKKELNQMIDNGSIIADYNDPFATETFLTRFYSIKDFAHETRDVRVLSFSGVSFYSLADYIKNAKIQ